MPMVVGIDLAAGRGITEVAVLIAEDGSRPPVFDAPSHRRVVTDAEIVAAVAAARPSVLAIDAPLTLPRAVMRGLARAGEYSCPSIGALPAGPAPTVGASGWTPADANSRNSPYMRAAERDPIWSTLGIRPLPVSFLGGLTFRAISLLPQVRAAAPSATIIEVFPSATLRQLGITQAAADRKAARTAKTTEESRKLVQRVLMAAIAGMASPDEETYGADLLDALAAALTAVAYMRGEYLIAGDVDEGAIVLPA